MNPLLVNLLWTQYSLPELILSMMYVCIVYCIYDINHIVNRQKYIKYWLMSFWNFKVKVPRAFVNTYVVLKITTKAMLAIVIWWLRSSFIRGASELMCTVTVERCSVEIRGTWDTNIGDKYASWNHMLAKNG